MPVQLKQMSREAYCSAPSIASTLRPPRLTRDIECRRPRAPLCKPHFEVKAEISSIESYEDVPEEKPDVNPAIPFDPRQRGPPLQAGIAALAIRPSSSSSSINEEPSAAPGPPRYAEAWGLRGQRLSHVPEGDLGPADPPRRRGRPRGSKSRQRVPFEIATPGKTGEDKGQVAASQDGVEVVPG